ncbi:quinone oxidoreductase family protein [Rhizobium tumorigenes]|uniref:quinone oxidoreductase family protein n=1 Tax=Rhizobium tumorigenes TaxID=2041385 RepID=UPI00241CF867|nr:zinc-binding alcohol dehydrogenase family protein [Rhizobium tumorigenes]WFS00303.1 zinc-binding alcohol dehydrogenase family protein [Rhizobium tumorigenes]
MKAAIVTASGHPPVLTDIPEPVASAGEVRIKVTASAVSQVTKSRASGHHYSAAGQFPFGVGIDGVGTLDDGQRVYFVLPRPPVGAMADVAVIAANQCIPLADDLDDLTAAAIANPGMSSWAAYSERARLQPGETVLVNGATGTSGRLAIQIARHLGAGKVIAIGRGDKDSLRELEALGADVVIPLGDDQEAFKESLRQELRSGVDVVVDYLWGKSAEAILSTKAETSPAPTRFVQVGSITGSDINLSASILRSSAIDLMGSGIGSVPPKRFLHVLGEVLKAAAGGRFQIAFKPVPFSEFDEAYPLDASTCRTVFKMPGARVPNGA